MTPSHDTARPRVIEEDAPAVAERPFRSGPAVFATDASERIVPPQQAVTVTPRAAAPAPRRRDKWVRLGLWALGIGIAGWIAARLAVQTASPNGPAAVEPVKLERTDVREDA